MFYSRTQTLRKSSPGYTKMQKSIGDHNDKSNHYGVNVDDASLISGLNNFRCYQSMGCR